MNQSIATNTYLVISRGKWDEDAKKEDVQQVFGDDDPDRLTTTILAG